MFRHLQKLLVTARYHCAILNSHLRRAAVNWMRKLALHYTAYNGLTLHRVVHVSLSVYLSGWFSVHRILFHWLLLLRLSMVSPADQVVVCNYRSLQRVLYLHFQWYRLTYSFWHFVSFVSWRAHLTRNTFCGTRYLSHYRHQCNYIMQL